jgi:hypothetical protein
MESKRLLMCKRCKAIYKEEDMSLIWVGQILPCFRCSFVPENEAATKHHFIILSNPKLALLFYGK